MLSEQIKKFRKEKNMTQQELAEKSGLSFTALTKIEQGKAIKPRIQTIEKLADALNVSIDKLVGLKN
jgi:transcriptional regulator with XRE-family HTH domain